MLDSYLRQLGLSDKERSIYVVLAGVGVQPASVIARRCGMDRVTTYKHLKKLCDEGLVKLYVRDSVQCFGIESFEGIERHLKDKLRGYEDLLENFPTAVNVLKSMKEDADLIPKLQIFEGESGIRALFRDIAFTARQEKVKQVRIFSSNTFEGWLGNEPLSKIVQEFFKELDERGITTEMFEATGSLVPEHVKKHALKQAADTPLTVAHGTTNILIVGNTVYLACYKRSMIGLKITQAELSQLFHFLLDVVGRKTAN